MGIEEAFALRDQHAGLLDAIQNTVARNVLNGEISAEEASVRARNLFERHVAATPHIIGHAAVQHETVEQGGYPAHKVTTAVLSR